MYIGYILKFEFKQLFLEKEAEKNRDLTTKVTA